MSPRATASSGSRCSDWPPRPSRAAAMSVPIPEGLSFEEAATLPVVFMTAWHALKTWRDCGRANASWFMRAQAASGWRRSKSRTILGAEVIASAGSPAKRALLETLGVNHVIDSRRGDFAEAVMELTGGEGRGCRAQLARRRSDSDGAFVPRGVRSLYRNRQARHLPELAHPALAAAAECVVSCRGDGCGLQRRRRADPRSCSRKIAGLVEAGALHPLPFRAFPACRIDAAFRLDGAGQAHRQSGRVLSRAFCAAARATAGAGSQINAGRMLPHHRRASAASARCWPNGSSSAARGTSCSRSRSGAATPEAEAFLEQTAASAASTCRSSRRMSDRPRTSTRLLGEHPRRQHPLQGCLPFRHGHRRRAARGADPRADARGASSPRPTAPGCCTRQRATLTSTAL